MQQVVTIVQVKDVQTLQHRSRVSPYGVQRVEHQIKIDLGNNSHWLSVGEDHNTNYSYDAPFEFDPHPYKVGDWALIKHPEVPAVVLRKLTKDNVGESWVI